MCTDACSLTAIPGRSFNGDNRRASLAEHKKIFDAYWRPLVGEFEVCMTTGLPIPVLPADLEPYAKYYRDKVKAAAQLPGSVAAASGDGSLRVSAAPSAGAAAATSADVGKVRGRCRCLQLQGTQCNVARTCARWH